MRGDACADRKDLKRQKKSHKREKERRETKGRGKMKRVK